jgi:hypothetical protein
MAQSSSKDGWHCAGGPQATNVSAIAVSSITCDGPLPSEGRRLELRIENACTACAASSRQA